MPGPTLDIEQWCVLVLAQTQVLCLNALQPVGERLLGARAGHHRQGVDEQADLLFDTGQLRRSSGHGGTEGHGRLPGVTLQQQQPGGLHQGIEGDFLLPGKALQVLGLRHVQQLHVLAVAVSTLAIALGQPSRLLQVGQLLAPEGFVAPGVLALQPADVVTVAAILVRWVLAVIALQYLAEQARVAPAIHQNVVAGVDQVMTRLACAHQLQAQQRRFAQGKPLVVVRFGQGLQRRIQITATTPVVHAEAQAGLLEHHLQRVIEPLPEEGTAQHRMRIHGCLPGVLEALGVETVHVHAHLIEVIAAGLLVQGVEQHALLHGRQRVNVLDTLGRKRQAIQLPLVQAAEREITGRRRRVLAAQAMLDQPGQFVGVGIGQGLQVEGIEHGGAEGPGDVQFAVVDLAVQAEPVAQGCVRALLGAGALAGRGKQRVLIEAAVELAEVVEGDARHRQRRQRLTRRSRTEITQGAEADALVRYGAQLLLDALDRSVEIFRRGQAHRKQAGEPAHGTGQVDVVEQRLATMPFQLHQHRGVPAPTRHHPCQGGQQQIVDLSAVGGRRRMQQLPGQDFAQARMHAPGLAVGLGTGRVGTGQRHGGVTQARFPAEQFLGQALLKGIALQLFGPGLDRAGFARQHHGLPLQRLAVSRLQVFEENAPGHPVHGQVVNRQQ
ncbi:hypothetical protein D3C80_500140 [compost metagenome]